MIIWLSCQGRRIVWLWRLVSFPVSAWSLRCFAIHLSSISCHVAVLDPSYFNLSPSVFIAIQLSSTSGISARISTWFCRSSANPSVVSWALCFSMAYRHLATTFFGIWVWIWDSPGLDSDQSQCLPTCIPASWRDFPPLSTDADLIDLIKADTVRHTLTFCEYNDVERKCYQYKGRYGLRTRSVVLHYYSDVQIM